MSEIERDYLVSGYTDFGEEIRKKAFDDASIQKGIDTLLEAAPEGKNAGVILAWEPKEDRIGARVYGKLPLMSGKFVWTYAGTLSYDYSRKDWRGGVQTAIWF